MNNFIRAEGCPGCIIQYLLAGQMYVAHIKSMQTTLSNVRQSQNAVQKCMTLHRKHFKFNRRGLKRCPFYKMHGVIFFFSNMFCNVFVVKF